MADADVVELELPDGASVLVRAQRIASDADEGPSDIGFKDSFSFSAVSSTLRSVAADIHQAIKAVEPDTAEVELGFEIAVKGSKLVCLLADGEAKTTLRVRLEWRKDTRTDDGADAQD